MENPNRKKKKKNADFLKIPRGNQKRKEKNKKETGILWCKPFAQS